MNYYTPLEHVGTLSLAGNDVIYISLKQRFRQEETIKPGLNEIDEIYRKCFMSNWGGNGEIPITQKVYENARNILNNLSDNMTPFTISPEEDGSISFEWYRNPNCVVWTHINPDGNLYYASLIEGSRDKGARALYEDLPVGMISSIRRLLEKNG